MEGNNMIFHCRPRCLWICSIAVIMLTFSVVDAVKAAALDMNLNDDTAEFEFITPVTFENSIGSALLNLGFLSTTSDDVMGIVGFQAVDEAGSATPGLKVGVGVMGFAGTIDSNDIYAVALGGNARVPVYNRVTIFGDIHFAPDVVTFGDASRLLYLNARLEYAILPQATVYLGYRKLSVNLNTGNHESIDNGANIGIQFTF
jgi:YfaZ precursor